MPCTQCARSAKFWMSPSTKGSMKQRMVQNAFGPVHKSLHTTCLKTTHGALILATGRSRGHTKDWIVTLENGPSPSQPLRAQCARSAHAVQELPHTTAMTRHVLSAREGLVCRLGCWISAELNVGSCFHCGCVKCTERKTAGGFEHSWYELPYLAVRLWDILCREHTSCVHSAHTMCHQR